MPENAACPNCGCSKVGKYCPSCGQLLYRRGSTLRELLAEGLNEITDVDGRVWRTLRVLLLNPGQITQDYLQERRARYLPPFRVYVLASLLLFLVGPWFGANVDISLDFDLESTAENVRADTTDVSNIETRNTETSNNTPIDANRDQSQQQPLQQSDVVDKEIEAKVFSRLPQIGFVMLPFATWALMLLYFGRRIPFADHFVAVLHITTVVALFMALAAILSGVTRHIVHVLGLQVIPFGPIFLLFAVLLSLTHIVISLHVIYRGRWYWDAARGFVLFFAYLIIATVLVLLTATAFYFLDR